MSVDAHGDSPRADESKDCSKMKRSGRGKKTDNLAKLAHLNPSYHKHEFKQKLGDAFREGGTFDHETKASLTSTPFPLCCLPGFLREDRFLERLRDELLDAIFYEKNNDLYKFQQSDDLKKISTPHVKALRCLLHKDVLDWMRDVTGIALTDKVDLTCSKYEYTDTLLCHDDELEGRRIAFILYLVPPWKPSDGGALDLFDMDEYNQPRTIVKSITPQWNQFTWFEVSPASHHQVAEVLTQDKTRLSIGGWFHGPNLPRPPTHDEVPLPLLPHISVQEGTLFDWINPIYLDMEVQSQIQEKFEADSEIELQGFLREDNYQALLSALTDSNISWRHRGPRNKRNYEEADEDSVPEIVARCLAFMHSEELFLTLSNLTGLRLHALAPGSSEEEDSAGEEDSGTNGTAEGQERADKIKPKKRRRLNTDGSVRAAPAATTDDDIRMVRLCNPRCRGVVRRWTHGSYTLAHDSDSEGCNFALDAMLFSCCKGWQPEYGGFTSYIAQGEDEELLTVNPAENSLALVYRDKETMRFVKHINHRIKEMPSGPEFYDISFSYFE